MSDFSDNSTNPPSYACTSSSPTTSAGSSPPKKRRKILQEKPLASLDESLSDNAEVVSHLNGLQDSTEFDECHNELEDDIESWDNSSHWSTGSDISISSANQDSDSESSSADSFQSDFSDEEVVHLIDSEDEEWDTGSVLSDSDQGANALHAYVTLSLDEAVLKLMTVFIQNRWTKDSLDSVLGFLKFVLPKPNLMPSSKHLLIKFLLKFTPEIGVTEHFYCAKCLFKKSNERRSDVCPACNDETAYGIFYNLSTSDQIKYMFEERELASAVEEYKKVAPTEECVSDIIDGSMYRKVKIVFKGKYDLTLILNTDGIALTSSSKSALWPVLSIICEVSPHIRSKFMIINCIWVDHCQPKINLFLEPLAESLQNLAVNGVDFTHPKSHEVINCKVVAPVVVADAPARAKLLVQQNHNSKYGCNICEQKSVRIQPTCDEIAKCPRGKRPRRKRRFVFQEEPATLRTERRMDLQGQAAEESGEAVKGVLGHSVISDIPHLDRAKCIHLDYLHLVLLGVVKMLLLLWIETPGPWNISKNIDVMDGFINKIKVPDHISRLPRSLKLVKYWKANELRSWLLFYSLPCIQGVIAPVYFQHYMLLVCSVYLLLQNSISSGDYEAAETMLRIFVRDIGVLYRLKEYTYSVHGLLHLVLCCKRWGPLWNSAFIFEDFNGKLARLIHGSNNIGVELLLNLRMLYAVQVLKNKVNLPSKMDTELIIMSHFTRPTFSKEVHNVLAQKNLLHYKCFKRAKIVNGNVVYTSQVYDVDKKRGNSFVAFADSNKSDCFGQIIYFFRLDGSSDVLCLLEMFLVNQMDLLFHEDSQYQVKHLVPVEASGELVVMPLSIRLQKVIKVGNYVCLEPNKYECYL